MVDLTELTANKNLDGVLENTLGSLKKTINLYFKKPDDDGILFLDVLGTQSMEISSDVTEYYVEDNSFYQDNISFKPKTYTIQGEVCELAWYNKDIPQTQIGFVNQKLMPIAEFTPLRSAVGRQIMDKVTKVQQLVEQVDNLWSRLSRLNPNANKQQTAYLYLQNIAETRQPISVNTPWTVLPSVVLTNVRMSQPERTYDRTQISLTFKEFRTTYLGLTSFNKENYLSRAEQTLAPFKEQGVTTGRESVLYNIKEGFLGIKEQ